MSIFSENEEYKALIDPMLEEEVQFGRELAEKMKPSARLG